VRAATPAARARWRHSLTDGSWQSKGADHAIWDTCFAVLFLRRATRPLVDVASVDRATTETRIFTQVNLDGRGIGRIRTGVGFFDHMLEQLSRHSLIDLTVNVEGDLRVDEHHTVEDTAITIGEAVARALGSRKGIRRYGFLLPMDDTLVEAALDLGGRPYFVFNGKFQRKQVGELPTEMVEHFFRSLAEALKANLHLTVRYSRNTHHAVEALFKAVAKSLRMACEHDARAADQLPTTKGLL
jgi:imidazoleglycerol-phosphate dehydratase/histidinol-phosphatase